MSEQPELSEAPGSSGPPRPGGEGPTLFERIIAGEVPGEIVAESEYAVALRDIDPKAPTHVLVVTRHPYPDLAALAASDPGALVDLHRLAVRVAESEGVAESGWRLVFNTGADAGQSVPHVHGHVLGGRHLAWPPG